MYYLRKEPYEVIIPEIKKTDGTVIPERKILTDDRAIYKADDCERFYRQNFSGFTDSLKTLKKSKQFDKQKYKRFLQITIQTPSYPKTQNRSLRHLKDRFVILKKAVSYRLCGPTRA